MCGRYCLTWNVQVLPKIKVRGKILFHKFSFRRKSFLFILQQHFYIEPFRMSFYEFWLEVVQTLILYNRMRKKNPIEKQLFCSISTAYSYYCFSNHYHHSRFGDMDNFFVMELCSVGFFLLKKFLEFLFYVSFFYISRHKNEIGTTLCQNL